MRQVTSCVVDIETTSLNADFGVILVAVVKGDGDDPVVLRADKLNTHWSTKRSDDRSILRPLVKELAKYDIWIAHNGAKFDIPFIRTRLLKWKLPPLVSKKLIDPVQLARNKLKMSYNSLEKLSELRGNNNKTEVIPDLWVRAALDGCVSAMNYIAEHCVQDVLMLEDIVGALKDYSTNYNTHGSGF